MTLADGRVVAYAAFVAPALLATAAMNGAVFETIFNVFFKLNYAKTYDGVLATPMGITEIAIGEMLWALMRAALYAVAMFVIMLIFGLILSPWGMLMVPAALLVAAAFAAAGLAGTSYLRTVNDFDVPMGLIVMPMFLFSGTFFPIEVVYRRLSDQVFVQLTPLYHAINLIRGLSTGIVGIGPGLGLRLSARLLRVCLWIAMRQMEQSSSSRPVPGSVPSKRSIDPEGRLTGNDLSDSARGEHQGGSRYWPCTADDLRRGRPPA